VKFRSVVFAVAIVAALAVSSISPFLAPAKSAEAFGDPSWCTWWLWEKRPDLPMNLGNAMYWAESAKDRGFEVGLEPRLGACAVFQPGVQWACSVGHVAYVEEVYPDSTFLVSEHGWGPDPSATNYRVASSDPNIGADGRPNVEFIYAPQQIIYTGHSSMLGWLNEVSDGGTAGTTGMALPMEAICIHLSGSVPGASVRYQADVDGCGWLDWVRDGQLSGTVGQSRRMNALRIALENAPANAHLEYRAHVEGYGWLSWVRDGEIAGMPDLGLRLEAVQIRLVFDS
jgi:hypothetical protein